MTRDGCYLLKPCNILTQPLPENDSDPTAHSTASNFIQKLSSTQNREVIFDIDRSISELSSLNSHLSLDKRIF